MELLYSILYLIACSAAIYTWRHYKHSPAWIFLPFLIFVVLNDQAAMFLRNRHYAFFHLMNIYLIVSFLVYNYWFYQILRLPKWIILFQIIFILASLYELDQHAFNATLYTKLMVASGIQAIVCSVVYLRRLLLSEKVVIYYKLHEFWILSGYLFFFIGALPLLFFRDEIVPTAERLYNYTLFCLNAIYYLSFVIAFYVARFK